MTRKVKLVGNIIDVNARKAGNDVIHALTLIDDYLAHHKMDNEPGTRLYSIRLALMSVLDRTGIIEEVNDPRYTVEYDE